MKKVSRPARLFGVLLLACGALATAASADTIFSFSFNFPAAVPGGFSVWGSGILTATHNSGDQYAVTGITGTTTAFGNITGLLAPNTFDLNDNLLFFPSTPYLDGSGISFAIGTYADVKIYYGGGSAYEELSSANPLNPIGGSFTLSPIITPEPATAGLLFLAFVSGFFDWLARCKRIVPV